MARLFHFAFNLISGRLRLGQPLVQALERFHNLRAFGDLAESAFFRMERHLRAVASGDSNCATALGRSHGPEVAVVLVWIPVESLAYRTNTASMPRSRSAWFWGRAWSFAGQGISAVCLDIYKVMGLGVNSTQL